MVMDVSNVSNAEESAEGLRLSEHALSMAFSTDYEKPVMRSGRDHSPPPSVTDVDTASNYSDTCGEPIAGIGEYIPPPTDVPGPDRVLLKSVVTVIGDYNPLSRTASLTDSYIPILEARGGTDKDATGHRRDSIPIGYGVIDNGGCSAVVQYLDDVQGNDEENDLAARCNEALFRHLRMRAKGVIVRNNPGTLCPAAQAKLDTLLTELSTFGVLVLSTPELVRAMGAKDALVKIKHLQVGILDTSVYTTADQLMEGFRMSIAFQPRVIKQNRGSQGEGIWICKLQDESQYCQNYGDVIADLDTKLVLMEAFDNHVEIHTVAEFIEFCVNGRTELSGEWTSTGVGKYLEGGIESGAMLVDQRFLPRIVEGEVRCTMVGSELIGLVHKKPQEGGLSCTLQSGAIYTNYTSDAPEFSSLVNKFRSDIPHILECFGMTDQPLPLLWTADFIYGNPDEDGNDTFFVGEFNCSCVGVTQQLEFADLVGKTALEYATVGYGGQSPI